MRKLLLLLPGILFFIGATAQQRNYWSLNTNSRIVKDKAVDRLSFPAEFKLFSLNAEPLRQELFSVVNSRGAVHSVIIDLPNAAGQLEAFEVFEASNFEPALQERFPEIRAFSGRGITDRASTLKLSISPSGIQTMVFRADKENEFMEAYSADHQVYAVYRAQSRSSQLPWACSTEDSRLITDLNTQVGVAVTGRSGGNLKTMRLAQSVTAEYSNYFGATSSAQVSLVLAAVNATLTRCNGVYEKDLALHLNLIANTTSVFYYNASTDPYSPASTGAGGAWNNELQNTLTSVIGEANYDIGHLFGASGGGGNAGCIGCICTNGSKGKGFTSPADGVPQGDNFDIDYVVHEVGHQLGANHTFSMSNEGTGVNKEPGSGITIMGYAGITSQDLAPHSIAAYHQASIAQIQANLLTKTCPVTTTIVNATPVVATLTNYTIPKSTPFALTGSATDANPGDVLTYSWEQNDNASASQTGSASVASATKASGPNWISYLPTTSPTRYFPKLATILAGGQVSGPLPGGDAGANTEALSSVARTLNFRLTVRDNAPFSSSSPVSVGQTEFKDMVVTVSSTSGPFAVTAPNTAVSWTGGSTQTITWDVASTTATPVSCANVKISLSTDGGQTFPTVLAASTPNDGSEALVIPNTPSTTARIKVEAVGNIFFDISNANFTITAGATCGTPTGLGSSSITSSGATISWTVVSGALNYDVDYKMNSSGTWINAATATTNLSVSLSGLTASTLYDWRVRTNCSGSSSSYASAQFTTAAPPTCGTVTGLGSSSITSSGATVSWSSLAGANNYDVDYKINSSGTWTNAATATTSLSVNLSGLTASTLYDWRVRANCTGATGSYSTAQFTTAASQAPCVTAFEPNETQGTAATITTNTVNAAAISSTTDIDYYKFTTSVTSNFSITLQNLPGDYDLYLYNSGGTQIGSSEAGGTSNETITLANQAAGTYYVKVIGYSGAFSTTVCYNLNAGVTASGCISAYDNGTNGTTSGAATIPFNTNITGLINPSGDVDHYKVVFTTGGTITVTLTTLPADYDLKLLNSAGTQVAISQAGGTTSETINYTVAAGTYYVQVYGYNGANHATSCYTLKVQLGTATKPAAEFVSKAMLKVYPVPATHSLHFTALGLENPTGRYRIMDASGKVVSEGRMKNDLNTIDVSRFANGTYSLLVEENGNWVSSKFIKQ